MNFQTIFDEEPCRCKHRPAATGGASARSVASLERCGRPVHTLCVMRLANEGRNGEFDDEVRKVRERKVCKVQDVISA